MLFATLGLLLCAAGAAAQEAGTLEIGVFGAFHDPDRHLSLDPSPGFGGRLGWFVLPDLALEADGGFARLKGPGGDAVDMLPLHGRLVWNWPAWDNVSVLIGAGYSRARYGNDYDAWDDGVGGLVGFRLRACERLTFRLEGVLDHFGDPEVLAGDDESADNWAVQVGASWFFGKGAGGACDRDGDGVPNQADRCPDTPRGDAVDASGCSLPKDGDGDGVTDDRDQCPDTPRGDPVDARGCSLPKDADGDGVTDDRDQCPNTPKGEKVDARGCPLPKDADGDGVTDDKDQCPNTPKGEKVDAKGCPIPKVFEEGKKEIILEGVNFETNKAVLTPESQAILDRVAESLAAYPEIRVQVAGYTDSRGSRAYNVNLSQRRAESVRDYLVGKGIDAGRLTALGYGPDSPVASNDSEAGRARNRRVELHRVD